MKKTIYLCLAAALIGGGYYLEYVYTAVSDTDREVCEAAYREQLANQPDILEAFLKQCRNPATLIAMRANGGQLGAKEAAQQMSAANRTNIIKTIIAFGLMGGGIGAIGATFARKKKTAI
ncbi:hypothetical protein AB4Y96_16285 [Phyllobacterium sp. TAF24]|uniref:hypothetical protein n=1 Tax=Phyllobacterium sp. TAF24 TaxID=3233068 RepID=UPI003F9DF4A2